MGRLLLKGKDIAKIFIAKTKIREYESINVWMGVSP